MTDEKLLYYLKCDISELNTYEARQDLIMSDNKYYLIWFCQRATSEKTEALLNEEGINMLLSSPNAKYIINGGLLNGSIDNNLLKNQKLCEFIHANCDGFSYMLNTTANDYLSFLENNYPNDIPYTFSLLYDGVQLNCLKNRSFDYETINSLFYRCQERSMKYLINNDDRINLDNANYSNFLTIAKRKIVIPEKLISETVTNNLSTMLDVNKYRFLMNSLSNNNDMSKIEKARKKYVENELSSLSKEGLLPEYQKIKNMLNKGENLETIIKSLGKFEKNGNILNVLIKSGDKETAIKQLNDYQISNMIIDYFFEAIPSNIIADIQEVVDFQEHKSTLSNVECEMYSLLANIDELNTKDKLTIFHKLKGHDLVSKFYDDYTKTKNQMVDELNESILNENNIEQFEDKELSKLSGVPIYVLKGQEFKALIRGWGQDKDYLLKKSDIEYRNDGVSFSIDSSELLQPFQNPKDYYTIAYSNIPRNQLVHVFPTDSYTNYHRDKDTGVPEDNDSSSSRIIKLMSPKELTSTSVNYNELLIAVPNSVRADSEFDEKLEEPKPLAIYCYDEIKKNDIEAAKMLGIGIIIIRTKDYDIDRNNRLSAIDTLTLGKDINEYDYLKENMTDPRLARMFEKPVGTHKTAEHDEID